MPKRVLQIWVIILISFVILLGRLFHLQCLEGPYYRQAGRRVIAQSLTPSRGSILTQDGVVLAEDRPAWDLMIVFHDFKEITINNILALYKVHEEPLSHDQLVHQIEKAKLKLKKDQKRELKRSKRKKLSDYQEKLLNRNTYLLFKKVPQAIWQTIVTQQHKFPGIQLRMRSTRVYPQESLAVHVVGSTSLFSHEDRKLTNKDGKPLYPFLLDLLKERRWLDIATDSQLRQHLFFPHDVIGRNGLERSYENQLRGKRGVKLSVKEIKNNLKKNRVIEEIIPQNGQTLITTLNSQLQKICEKALENHCTSKGGGIVFLDASTGAIQAMASWPTYKAGYITQEHLDDHVGRPLRNKCIEDQVPQASVFKVVTAIAALEEGLMRKHSRVFCSTQGFKARGTPVQRCWIANKYERGHGSFDVVDALAHSCNIWFFQTALKLRYQRLKYWAYRFGYGKKTGVDLPREVRGQLPTRKQPEITNFAIGEGNFQATILQAAHLMAIVATKGTDCQPHLIKTKSSKKKKIPTSHQTWEIIHEGLRKTVTEGTAINKTLIDMKVSGKTGTAQLGKDRASHLWFAGFVTLHEKNYSFAICLFNAEGSGVKASDVIAEILEEFRQTDL